MTTQTAGSKPKNTRKALLPLKLGACLMAPTRRMVADLHATALNLNRVRNRQVRFWVRWFDDRPREREQPIVDESDNLVLAKSGEPLVRGPADPDWSVPNVPGKIKDRVGMSTRLYHLGMNTAPTLHTSLVVESARETLSNLGSKMPYTHPGPEQFRWEAVLNSAINMPSYTAMTIPVPNVLAGISYEGVARYCLNGKGKPKIEKSALACLGGLSAADCEARWRRGEEHPPSAGAAFAFPLFSSQAGRDWGHCVCRLNVRKLPPGHKKVLRQIVSGHWKMSDSELVFKPANPNSSMRRGKLREKGTWYLHLCYERPPEEVSPDPSKVAVLWANDGSAADPFRIETEREAGDTREGPITWKIGRGELFLEVFRRLEQRRRGMREHYTTAGGALRGHGRRRVERDIRPITRQVQNFIADATKKIVAEIVRFCLKWDCGVLRWRELSEFARSSSWFAAHKGNWDWTTFQARLSHQLWLHGIVLDDGSESEGGGRKPGPRSRATKRSRKSG